MPTLDKLFNSPQRARLCAAISKRVSCRAFTGELSPADLSALTYAAERYRLPGARLHVMRVSESLFTGTLLNMGRVTGCTTAAVVVASSSEPLSRIHAGISGEAFCLDAVSMDFGCCWISGTYRKKSLMLPLGSDEAVLGIIALGHPLHPLTEPPVRRRKPIERLCKGSPALWPEEIKRVAEAVREAPSAMNLQPWSMSLEQTRFILDASDRAQLDLGIALCHAELTLSTPHSWHFAQTRKDPAAWAQVK